VAYEIDKRRVDQICTATMREFGQGNFNHGEILVGLAEAIGRITVDVCTNLIQMGECVDIVNDHLRRTIAAGAKAKGYVMDTESGNG